MRSIRKSCARKLFPLAISAAALLLPVFQASAIIDAALQMQLGNPTGATIDTNNHSHYLIQRTVEAIDYSDNLGEPNWASWDLTSSDYVVGGWRSSSFYTDTSLPAGFYRVRSDDYSGSGYSRGHMCPSADRTDSTNDNKLVFLMSNMIPQNQNQNGGVWGGFEDDCRSLLSTQELLITCGPRGFGSTTIAGGRVYVPSNTWKIAVCVPLGGGTALDRITNATAASIRVIAIDIPNSAQSDSWPTFVTSAKQLQDLTGFSFFNALPNNLAWVLRSKVDGQAAAAPSFGSFSPSSGSQSNSVTISGAVLDTITNIDFNGTVAAYTITATNQIIALVPVGASSGQITVWGLGGNATSVSSFTVAPPVLPDFTVTPDSAFTSSGDQGGPFSPSSQIYTLNNTNATTLNWAVAKNASWLDLSASSGTLDAGTSTDITVTVNSAANSFLGGIYSDTVTFSNATTLGWVPRSVNLTVLTPGQLAVSPVNTFSVMELVGGPFSPASQDYTLSNTGSISLNWTASATATWLNLSAVSGTLAGGSSTVVTASIDSSAITLPQGSYSDEIGFTNTTNGAGSTTRSVSLTVNSTFPVIVTNGWTLSAENCAPSNGVVDPGETVTVSLSVKNTGTADTTNLVATLSESEGVNSPSGPQTYGVVSTDGTPVSEQFSFTAGGTCGGVITATLQLQDGAADLGTVSFTIPLGLTATVFTQNFDSVAAPSLPAGWATSASGAQSSWVTATTSADTAPNAAFSPDPSGVGVNELDTPSIAINSGVAQLTFRQNYSLVLSTTNNLIGYDGGVLEIAIGGGSYQDIVTAGGSFISGGYNMTLSGDYSNPLAGRQAWSGNSGSFITTTVNLPATAAGQNVQLRWRCATGNTPPPVTSSGTLAYWNFDAQTATPNVTASNISVSAVTVNNLGSGGALTYYGSGGNYAIAGSGSFTASAGPPTTSYSCFAFALTVASGSQMSLSSISFSNRASNTGPTKFDVQISQVSNFASTNYDSGEQNWHGGSTWGMDSFALTNANLTGTVYFRIYAYQASGGTWRIDNLNIQGSVTSGGSTVGSGWYVDSVSIQDAFCCNPNLPVADFTGSPTAGPAPLMVTFNDNSTGGTISNWFWDFGDFSTTNVTTNSIVHTYAAGTYGVMLVVTGPGGVSTNTKASYITAWTPFQAWQVLYFGDINNPLAASGVDPDGDGMNNLQEFLTGTDPTNSASALRITSIAKQGTNVVVTWMTGVGKTNALQVTSGGSGGSYATNGFADLFTVTNTVGTVTNGTDVGGATSSATRYYRVRLVP